MRLMVAILMALGSPALAQDDWRHVQSGITLPGSVDDMRRGPVRDIAGDGFDMIFQYGTDAEPATVYLYRAAYPNPALWFERTRIAMNINVGSGDRSVAAQSFTLGQATGPNGIREDITLPPGGRFRATSVAIARIGAWIVKVRITSSRMDRTEIAARMDRLLGAIRPSASDEAPPPLLVPGPCGETPNGDARPVGRDRDAALAGAMAAGLVEIAEARGVGGLANTPAEWCRDAGAMPDRFGAVYRRRDGTAWVALVGDAGMAISGRGLVPADEGAAVFASTVRSTRVAQIYDALPRPEAAFGAALSLLTGAAPGLLEISEDGSRPQP